MPTVHGALQRAMATTPRLRRTRCRLGTLVRSRSALQGTAVEVSTRR